MLLDGKKVAFRYVSVCGNITMNRSRIVNKTQRKDRWNNHHIHMPVYVGFQRSHFILTWRNSALIKMTLHNSSYSHPLTHRHIHTHTFALDSRWGWTKKRVYSIIYIINCSQSISWQQQIHPMKYKECCKWLQMISQSETLF